MPDGGRYEWTRFRLAKSPFALGKTRGHEWPLMSECLLPDGVTGEWHQHLEKQYIYDALAKLLKLYYHQKLSDGMAGEGIKSPFPYYIYLLLVETSY